VTNPYQTPEGQLTDDDQAYGEIKFFSPSSRINRLRYWAHSMLFSVVLFTVIGIAVALGAIVSPALGFVIGVPAYIGAIVFSFILIIQRLHDLNKSGWMSLLMLVPLANIYLFILVVFFKGTDGRNDYGLQTPPNKTWHWVLALMMPVLMVVSIVVAVALPSMLGLPADYDAGQVNGYEDSAQMPSEYTDESTYPTDDSGYTEDTTESVDESMDSTDGMEESLPEENVEDESEAVDESTSEETPQ